MERRSEEEGMGALERGRRRYQNQDFAGALEAFTEAVDISSDHILLNALDSRAATYEKLGQLQLALRDAKEMIDRMPKSSKGYLRCGKVLQLKKQPIVALKIYERGLTKVKIGSDDGRIKLQSMYNKLREAQNPGKSRDPLQHLPLELAEMVIKNLTMRDKVVCLAVSRSWRRLLESSHKLWTTFDTTNVKRMVTQKSLKIHLRRSNWTLERAIFSSKAGIDAQKLSMMTKNCKKLREIQFLGHNFIGDTLTSNLPYAKKLDTLVVGEGSEVSLSTVQTLLGSCGETLVDVRFLSVRGSPAGFRAGKWPTVEALKRLHLKADTDSHLDIEGLCKATPNLDAATLNCWRIEPDFVDLSPWSKLRKLDIRNTQLRRWPILPPTLIHLNVSDNTLLNISADDPEPLPLPLLEMFACHSTFITASYLKKITEWSIKAGNLKKLLVGGRDTDFENIPIGEEFPPADSLEELSLAEMIIGDQRMIQVIALYPNLRKLDASATKITGVAVKHFISKGIKWLRLNECQDISADAVERARAKGVEVEYLFPSRGGSGRKARFGDSAFARVF